MKILADISELSKKIKKQFEDRLSRSKAATEKPISGNVFDCRMAAMATMLPYEAYDEENQLFINKRSAGFILECSPLIGAAQETESILTSLLTDVLPLNATIQWLMIASDDIAPILKTFQQARSAPDSSASMLASKRVEHYLAGRYQSLSKVAPFHLRDFRLFLSIGMPFKFARRNEKEVFEELRLLRRDFIGTMQSVGIESIDIPIASFIRLFSHLLSPSERLDHVTKEYSPYDNLNIQLTDPSCHLAVHHDKLICENDEKITDIRSFTVNTFPKDPWYQYQMTEQLGQLLNAALQIPCPFAISLTIRVLDPEKASMASQFHSKNKKKNLGTSISEFNANAEDEYAEWEVAKRQIAKGGRLVKAYYQVTTFASVEQGGLAERKVRDLYRANGFKLAKANYLQLPSYLSLFPLMMSDGLFDDFLLLKRHRTMNAMNAISLAPLQGEWKGFNTPCMMLPGRRGQIAFFDPFDNPGGNYNVAIAASSGKGKSVFAQELIKGRLSLGGSVWVLDVGRSYEKMCEQNQGQFIRFDSKHKISINPFTHIADFEASFPQLKSLLAVMARPTSPISDEESSWIEKAIKAAWLQQQQQATITTVANWLQSSNKTIAQNLHLLLSSYCQGGMFEDYFEPPCTINFNNRLIVLELEELKNKPALQKVVLLTLMQQITDKMYLGQRDNPKMCIIDEAWDLMGDDHEETAKFIETGYRRARRYSGSFVTIAQGINDYFRSKMSESIYENSDFKVILPQKEESLQGIKDSKRLDMDELAFQLIKSLRTTSEFSEMFIKSPLGYSVHRLVLDPYSRILYSSKGTEFSRVNALRNEGKSLHEAILITMREFGHV